jgi:hypothetical protein
MNNLFKLSFILLTLLVQNVQAQTALASEPVFKLISRLTDQLPANIHEAHQQRDRIKPLFDSLEQAIMAAYPSLANKVKMRSARLNAMINHTEEGARLLFILPNEKMSAYFINEWDKMDALERTFNKAAPSFIGNKELYKKQGYLPVWDSVYQLYRPALIKYRDGVFKLVQAEIAYLKAASKMFSSSNEDERMQWVEAELGVLQKLVLLGSKYKKLAIDNGIDKVEFCIQNPGACQKQ